MGAEGGLTDLQGDGANDAGGGAVDDGVLTAARETESSTSVPFVPKPRLSQDRRLPQGLPDDGSHPRVLGWFGTAALAMGGSNQSLFLLTALVATQGSAADPAAGRRSGPVVGSRAGLDRARADVPEPGRRHRRHLR